jgi:hypothetical protein
MEERGSPALAFWGVLLDLSSELAHGIAYYGHVYRDERPGVEDRCDKGDK